ncbi:MAG: hypothetical protein JRM76_07990 [Nitrososphaerota archaeon]|jgi:predicted transcriptional regulator|nr:hypothetical protein [Nitrososphaerota archaeon]MDG6937460.1 hypothetical protein [Nitrososphaerota archaeon]MDG6970641.1 hypothetical protein [Nitrososphaerota archaeon]MDG6973185.1 hypothetical protein [Nitrososphaerota archaeon]MDG6993163.1 hypothetical protein [Nitrososphaerota archaeon]
MDTTPVQHKVGRRSRFEILCDILKVVSDGANKPTHIMQMANLTWNGLLSYLESLMRNGLLARQEGPRTTYILTARGKIVLNQYLSLKEALVQAELDTLSKDNVLKALKLPVADQANESVVKSLKSKLRSSGLKVEDGMVMGKSGVKQVFDFVAKAKDGSAYGYAVLRDVDEAHVLGLFVKQLDTGLGARVVYTGSVSSEAKALASSYAVRLEHWIGEEEQKQIIGTKLDLARLSGKKVLLQVDPSVGYESAVRSAVSDCLAEGRKVFTFTWRGSPIYDAVSTLEGMVLYTMNSEVSYTTAVPGRDEFLVPEGDGAVLLDVMAKAIEADRREGVVIVFDSISDMLMISGVQQTFEFLRQMAKIAAGADVTTFSILKLLSQDERTTSLIKGIYSSHLVYDASGIKVTR